MPPRKLAIHIAVNEVDKTQYPKPPGALRAPEADARAMFDLTNRAAFDGTLLVGLEATRDRVMGVFRTSAADMVADDLLVVSFSGHGAVFADAADAEVVQRPPGAVNRLPGDEPFDQSWCLRDGVLIDDDLHLLLCDFRVGVRIYVLSDSCYSGTILRLDGAPTTELTRGALEALPTREVTASVLLSAAASDTELTYTTIERGVFTKAILDTWDEGHFPGTYADFHAGVRKRSAPGQVPALGRYGRRSKEFEGAPAFQ